MMVICLKVMRNIYLKSKLKLFNLIFDNITLIKLIILKNRLKIVEDEPNKKYYSDLNLNQSPKNEANNLKQDQELLYSKIFNNDINAENNKAKSHNKGSSRFIQSY